jgi:hypothetical protein
MKLKYFYKFMRSGFKFWKFRKVCHRIDQLAVHKIKTVFLWLLKKELIDDKESTRIENFVQGREKLISDRLCKKALKAFEINRSNNKRLKRVMGGIFERNLELDFYVAFGKIRN